jgi:uncharacterized membrane protein
MGQKTQEPSFTDRLIFPANVGEAEQWWSVLGGLALGWYGLRHRARLPRPLQWGLLSVGGLLMARGVTAHCALYRVLGLNSRGETPPDDATGPSVAHLEHTVTVHRPVEEVYRFWRNVENWPQVMPHLESVTSAGRTRFHWSMKGPAGATVTWNAAITDDRPNRLIAWQSMTQSGGNHRGAIRFRSLASGDTDVCMSLDYHPSSGPVGIATGHALGDDPAHRVQEHLAEFKRLMEPAVGAS